jgi:ankyrin repeat protein
MSKIDVNMTDSAGWTALMKAARIRHKEIVAALLDHDQIDVDQRNNIGKSALEWGCTTGNAATVAHSTKKTTSGNDSVIEGQPLLLLM